VTRARNLSPDTLSFRLGSSAEVRRARKERSTPGRRGRRPTSPGTRKRGSAPRDRHHPEGVRRRIFVVATALLLFASAVVARSAQLQIQRHDDYRDVADRQASAVRTVRAQRGPILDRHGNELAISVQVDSVFAEPRRVRDPEAAAAKLAPILRLPKARLAARLRGDRAFTYLKRRVDPEIGAKVRSLKISGVSTHPEPRRFYPNRGLGAHVLGFTDIDEVGKLGLELSFDEGLRGGSMTVSALRDALGQRVLTEGFVPPSSLDGEGLELTLDRQVQYVTESVLADAVTSHGGRAGVAIVLEVDTGDILGLASYPTFNPNNLNGSEPNDRLNRALSAEYEPGSTMKMFTIAAALEDGVFSPESRIDCEGGKWRVGGRTIHDSHAEDGELTISDVLRVSSNVCAAKVGMAVGRRRLDHWLRAFGFGAETNIGLPGELDGRLDPGETWRDIRLANIAFGQGLTVTPLQLAQATAAIANDGVLVPPRLVQADLDQDGRRRPRPTRPGRRVLSSRTAARLRGMLAEVVGPRGTASKAAIPGVRVAGKTGTAQKIDPVTRAYSHELFVASFVGMVPADDPELVVLVLVDEPQDSIYGGVVAPPAFRRIAQAALTARGSFVGSEPVPAPPRAAPIPRSGFEDDAHLRARSDLQLPPAEVPPIETALSARARALLEAEPANRASIAEPEFGLMPDLRGLELREVLQRCAEVQCRPRFEGTGPIVDQRPAPGARIEAGSVWRLSARISGVRQ